ncbi:MAG: phospho-N-acetylmuramoyl-pentapeptide-transferase [Clostridiales bacterium]|nr:phospho-N-acetylmuramoyl-pentapeptide-transferase [Clostridiales bacterium]
MLRLILALVLSIIAMLLIGPRVLPVLRKLKFGQTIYELGPQNHKVKQGTPTMGGLMFAAVTCVVALLVHKTWLGAGDFTIALVAVSLLSMLIGFVDDYIKVVKKRNLGLIWWQKIIGQVIVCVAFSVYCYLHPMVGSKLLIPFFNVEWDLGIFYVPLMSIVMIFMINSANLQDGLDGLLSTVTIISSVTWGLMALLVTMASGAAISDNYQNLAVFAMALAGGCMGFLRFNHYPALVFMGDTGSMFIGGAAVGMSMLMRMPIFMIFVLFTLIMSSLSVIIQRIYFKVTHGKRIFKMSPIHHHFELCGMSEQKIVSMYAIVQGVLCVIALISLQLAL